MANTKAPAISASGVLLLLAGCAVAAPASDAAGAAGMERAGHLEPPPAPPAAPAGTGADPLGPHPERALEAQAGHEGRHRNQIALSAGWGVETRSGGETEGGLALGVEYEYRLNEHWGIGGVVEGLGLETSRNMLLAVPVSYHPDDHWRFAAGPGLEFAEDEDNLALRLIATYEFPLAGGWSLAPELDFDLIESGNTTWVLGLAIGRGF